MVACTAPSQAIPGTLAKQIARALIWLILQSGSVSMTTTLSFETALWAKPQAMAAAAQESRVPFLERIQQQEVERLSLLRAAWREGIDSGDARELDFKALKQEARARLVASKT